MNSKHIRVSLIDFQSLLSYKKLKNSMGAIIIKADIKSNKILTELAKKLGGNVLSLKDEQFEDFALGVLMNKVKTNELVSRETIIKKLKRK